MNVCWPLSLPRFAVYLKLLIFMIQFENVYFQVIIAKRRAFVCNVRGSYVYAFIPKKSGKLMQSDWEVSPVKRKSGYGVVGNQWQLSHAAVLRGEFR